jgi:hypothetical protein
MNRTAPLMPFVEIAACAITLTLLVAILARRGLPRPAAGAFLVRHGPIFRWFTLWAGVLVPAGVTVILAVYRPGRADVPYLLILYGFFTGLIILVIWEAGRFYVLATADGLRGRSAWRGTSIVRWDNLGVVAFRPMTGCFEFVDKSGTRIRAHGMVAGLRELLAVVEARVPADALKSARPGYARLARTFPALPGEPILEARRPRRVGEW